MNVDYRPLQGADTPGRWNMPFRLISYLRSGASMKIILVLCALGLSLWVLGGSAAWAGGSGIPGSRIPAFVSGSSGKVSVDSVSAGQTQFFWAFAEGFFEGYYPLSATCQLVSDVAYILTEDAHVNDISAPSDTTLNPDSLTLFAACEGVLYKSYDSGQTWHLNVAGLPTIDGVYGGASGAYTSANYNRRSNLSCIFSRAEYGGVFDSVWVGTDFGPFLSTAYGDTFNIKGKGTGIRTDATEGQYLSPVFDVLGHPVETKTLWLATSDGVYITRNGGSLFRPLDPGLPASDESDWVAIRTTALGYESGDSLLFALTDRGLFYSGLRPLGTSASSNVIASWKPLGGTVNLEYFSATSATEDYLELRVADETTSHGLAMSSGQNVTVLDVTQNVYWQCFVNETPQGLIIALTDTAIFYWPEGTTAPTIPDYRQMSLGNLVAYGYAQVAGPTLYLETDEDKTTAWVGTEESGIYSYELVGSIKSRYSASQLTITNSHDGETVYKITKHGDLYYIATDQGLFEAANPHDEWTQLTGYIQNRDGSDSLNVDARTVAFGPNGQIFTGGYMGGFLRSTDDEGFETSNMGLIHRNGTPVQLDEFVKALEDSTPSNSDQGIWDTMQEWWGELPGPESSLDIDGDARIVVLFLDVIDNFYEGSQGNGAYLSGYYDGQNEFSRLVYTTSNQAEMIYLDTDPQWIDQAGAAACNQIFHLINWNQDPQEDAWVRGGLAAFSQDVAGYHMVTGTISLPYLVSNNFVQFNTSTKTNTGDKPDDDYQYSFLFMLYLYEQMFQDEGSGQNVVHPMSEIAMSPYHGASGMGRLIYEKTTGESTSDAVDYTPQFVEVFDDFILAIALDISDPTFNEGKYGFQAVNTQISAPDKKWYWPSAEPPPYVSQPPFWGVSIFQIKDIPPPNAFFSSDHPITEVRINADNRNQFSFYLLFSDSSAFYSEMPKDMVSVISVPVDPVTQKGGLVLPEDLQLTGPDLNEPPNNMRVLAICHSASGEAPTCYTFGDDTTAASELFVSVAQNPIDDRYIDIYSFTDERTFPDGGQLLRVEPPFNLTELEGPTVDISGGISTDTGGDTLITLDQNVFFSNTAGSSFLYHIAYHLEKLEFPADLAFRAYGEDACGNEKESDQFVVTVDFIQSDVGGMMENAATSASVYIPPSALDEDAYILLSVTQYPTEFIEDVPSRTIAAPVDQSHYAVGPLVSAGSPGSSLSIPIELEIPYNPGLVGSSEIGVYRAEGESWIYVGGVADPAAGLLRTYSWKFGQFQAFAGPLGDMKPELPYTFRMDQNYPNPFNPVTRIPFELTQNQRVKIDIYDIMGRHVARLADRNYDAGPHVVEWKPVNLSSGVYFLRLDAREGILYRKLMLLK